MSRAEPGAHERTPALEAAPLPVRSTHVVLWGMAVWAVLLVLTLAVPELHSGERSWWPWTCVSGLVLGLLGYVYVRRGRGNAEGAE